MNIRCPQCQTVFRVDPGRIPATGARARCARCGATFTVRPPSAPAASPPTAAAHASPQQRPAVQPTRPPARPVAQQPAPPARPAPPPERRAPVAAGAIDGSRGPAGRAAARAPAVAGGEGRRSPLGTRNPDARAERLARALVSDIVAYNPERRDRSLAEGTLRTEFREEILKSWEEYVAQVGDGVARSTPFFRDALNNILAKGQALF